MKRSEYEYMKLRVVDLLRSIPDREPLRVNITKINSVPFRDQLDRVRCSRFCARKDCTVDDGLVTPEDCTKCYGMEVMEGELHSHKGKRYPIIGGIPRLFSEEVGGWVKKNQETFSLEWRMFRFGERNWGQDIEFRKELFLQALGVTKEELKGRIVLDAGCGSGLLSIEMAESFGMEVVALDLAFGIEKAFARNSNPYVHFVQGSVLDPGVKDACVDVVYCAGVLVALPDAKAGFKALMPVLKPGGRYFIWMYHPIDERHHPHDRRKMTIYNWIRTNLTCRLPIGVQYAIYLSLVPLFVLKRGLVNAFGKGKDTRTWREKMQGLTDMFSPVFQHRFSEEEILDWFRTEGFVHSQISYTEEYGFGARGDAPVRPPTAQA